MCLRTITWQAKSLSNPRSKDKWQQGYKVFTVKTFGNSQPTIAYPFMHGPEIKLDGSIMKAKNTTQMVDWSKIHATEAKHGKRWYEISDKPYPEMKVPLKIITNQGQYLAGFHIFPVKLASRFYIAHEPYREIYLVEYRKVTAEGTHSIHTTYSADCVVAQEMRILRPLTAEEKTKLEQDYKNLLKQKGEY